MKLIHKTTLSLLAASALLFSGCSDSSDSESVAAAPAPEKATKDDLASGLANVQKKADDQAAKLKSEVSAALAKQREELLSELNANTSNLTSQMTGLKKQYDDLKGKLPDEVLKVVKEQIPDLEASIAKIKDMVAKFDPKSVEEIAAFKTKYQKEYDIAMDLIKKASTLLESSGVKVPKLF